jgi:hypothetical protein
MDGMTTWNEADSASDVDARTALKWRRRQTHSSWSFRAWDEDFFWQERVAWWSPCVRLHMINPMVGEMAPRQINGLFSLPRES